MKTVSIIQSNYLPWKGYFDLIAASDVFVIYDTAQYTRRDWRNRNRVKTRNGLRWLTVPVEGGGLRGPIKDVRIGRKAWQDNHLAVLREAYADCAFFSTALSRIEPILRRSYSHLSQLNEALIREICSILEINTQIAQAQAFPCELSPTMKLVETCKSLEATRYLSGPAAQAYLDVSLFEEANIEVQWFDYSGYPTYEQPWGEFEHGVSIFDLLCCSGPEARQFMKCGMK
ncbi:MAG: WbqC family protein [Alphaproteobacteria bacterium]|nr:WbqC family protein [Alphaproteobacteria bacterium]